MYSYNRSVRFCEKLHFLFIRVDTNYAIIRKRPIYSSSFFFYFHDVRTIQLARTYLLKEVKCEEKKKITNSLYSSFCTLPLNRSSSHSVSRLNLQNRRKITVFSPIDQTDFSNWQCTAINFRLFVSYTQYCGIRCRISFAPAFFFFFLFNYWETRMAAYKRNNNCKSISRRLCTECW